MSKVTRISNKAFAFLASLSRQRQKEKGRHITIPELIDEMVEVWKDAK